MEVQTLSFQYGNIITLFGMIGIISTFLILFTVFRSYYIHSFRR